MSCEAETVNDVPLCPQDGGDPAFLGTLGSHVWLRCRNCGWEWDITPDTIEEMEGETWDAK